MIYFFLFLAGLWIGTNFYFTSNAIMYFCAMIFALYIFYFYALRKEKNRKEKIFYVPIENIDEDNEAELPIIRL